MQPRHLEVIRAFADALRAEISDDTDALLDTLDGETDAIDALDAMLAYDAECRAMEAAAKAQADALRARATAFAKRSATIRGGIGQLLDAIGERKVVRPAATVSRTKPRQSVEVLDVDQLPQGFFRVERKALAKEIGDALKAGETVPGAELRDGAPGLMVRS